LIRPHPTASVPFTPWAETIVRIRLQDIEADEKELTFEEPTEGLNALLAQAPVQDYRFPAPATVEVRCYRSGDELFFSGQVQGTVCGQCARCLELFDFDLVSDFSFVFVPRRAGEGLEDDEGEEADLSFYEGEEVDLSPSLRERVLLSLPTLPLCREECRGLCPMCGANRNLEVCGCKGETGDPRLAVLRGLKLKG
jgi:uncharacterized protein